MFPLAYIFILGDILTEIYGYKYTRRAIWAVFGIMLLAVAAFTVVRYMPPAPEYTAQASYEAVLGFFPRIVAASLAAFLTGSTFVGEFFDTVVFALVAFGGILQGTGMLVYILIGWLFKTGVEVVCLLITYRMIAKMKQIEKIDTYDNKTDFTPFRVDLD